MNTERIEAIANAVLYEGYILYPYRPCIKNRRRWMFGCVAPRSMNELSVERWAMQTECLVEGGQETRVEIEVRFLQLVNRRLARRSPQLRGSDSKSHGFEFLDSCELNGTLYQTWQEAKERRIAIAAHSLSQNHEVRMPFAFPAERETETLGSKENGDFVFVREQEDIEGSVNIVTREIAAGLFHLSARIENTTPIAAALESVSDGNDLHSLVSAHTILSVHRGQFISAIDPPDAYRQASAELNNDGTWPVLVGDDRQRDLILSSPIILYDYPQVAPESPGDWFDATEIDEMLDLRTRTLTDNEKHSMRSVDERARRLLERTERADMAGLANLHGALRGLRRVVTGNR